MEEFYSTRIVPEIATAWEQVLRGGASIQTHITAQLHVTSSTPERRSGERERGEIGGGVGGGGVWRRDRRLWEWQFHARVSPHAHLSLDGSVDGSVDGSPSGLNPWTWAWKRCVFLCGGSWVRGWHVGARSLPLPLSLSLLLSQSLSLMFIHTQGTRGGRRRRNRQNSP